MADDAAKGKQVLGSEYLRLDGRLSPSRARPCSIGTETDPRWCRCPRREDARTPHVAWPGGCNFWASIPSDTAGKRSHCVFKFARLTLPSFYVAADRLSKHMPVCTMLGLYPTTSWWWSLATSRWIQEPEQQPPRWSITQPNQCRN